MHEPADRHPSGQHSAMLGAARAPVSRLPAVAAAAAERLAPLTADRRRGLPLALLALLIVVLPAVEVLLCLRWIPGASLRHFVPGGPITWWNDEIGYWHQAASFSKAGFGAGQYGWDEGHAPWAFSPFGPHGPVWPALLGGVGAIAGFSTATPAFVNVGAVTAALALAMWWWWPRMDAAALLLLGAVLATAWPVLLMLPGAMQEPVHAALAIVIGAGFAVLLRDPSAGRTVVWPMACTLILATLLRATWGALWVPFFIVIRRRRRSDAPVWPAIAAGVAVALAGVVVAGGFNAPYPIGFLATLKDATSVGDKLSLIGTNIDGNVTAMLGGKDPYGIRPIAMEQWQYDEIFVLLAAGLIAAIAALRRGRLPGGAWTVHLWNLVPVLVLTIVLYDALALRGMRVLSNHVLLTLVLAVGTKHVLGRAVAVGLAVVALAQVGMFKATFVDVHAAHYPAATPEVTPAAAQFHDAGMSFRAGAPRFCNTVLWATDINRTMLAVPRGMGVSFSLNPGTTISSPRSRWLLLPDGPDGASLARRWRLQARARLPQLGTLYENVRNPCAGRASDGQAVAAG